MGTIRKTFTRSLVLPWHVIELQLPPCRRNLSRNPPNLQLLRKLTEENQALQALTALPALLAKQDIRANVGLWVHLVKWDHQERMGLRERRDGMHSLVKSRPCRARRKSSYMWWWSFISCSSVVYTSSSR